MSTSIATSSTSSGPTTSLTTSSSSTTTSSSSSSSSSTSSSTSTTSTTSSSSSTTTSTTSTTSTGTGTGTTSSSSPTNTTTTTSSSSSSSTPSPVVSTSTDAQGGIITVTVAPSNTRNVSSQTGVGSGSSGDTSFFDNKGAVAGTFAAVGIVALALLILIVTAVIRRRRAKKWDDEVAAAAAEAANARVPVFLDDPEEGRYNNDHGYSGVAPSAYPGGSSSYAPTGYNNVGNYSDVSSHGTYGQPTMSHEDRFPEMSGPVPGSIFDHNAAYSGAGAAGIGVARARSRGAETMASSNTRNTGPSAASDYVYAAGVGEGGSPYPAFLAPGHGYDAYNNAAKQTFYNNVSDHQQPVPEGRTTHANAMASVAAAAAAGSGTGSMEQAPDSGPRTVSGESYASHYEPGFSGSGSPNRADGASQSPDASGRPSVDNSPTRREELPNPFTSRTESEDESDGEEEVPDRRVLKVANE